MDSSNCQTLTASPAEPGGLPFGTSARLNEITELFDSGKLVPDVGSVLPLQEVRTAHEMLGGAPHKRGKIVLQVS